MTLKLLGPALTTQVISPGISVIVNDGTLGALGGVITNPLTAIDQGVPIAESLWVSLLGNAAMSAVNGTVEVLPGQQFLVPPGAKVWATAGSSGHKFSVYFSSTYTVPYPPGPVPGIIGSAFGGSIFPPPGVTGLTNVIPSFLYQEYSDDDDLQGFVGAQNNLQQNFVDTFNALNLPIYTGEPSLVAGALLDWVGQGLYGMARPALGTSQPVLMGPLNTYGPNWLWEMWDPVPEYTGITFGLNEIEMLNLGGVVITDDDVYRRILTWHFYKGDNNYFNIRFLKRRVWRFCYGVNGTGPDFAVDPMIGGPHGPPLAEYADSDDAFIADTEQISVTIGVHRNVTIRFVLGIRTRTGGALPNYFGCNGFGIHKSTTLAPMYIPITLNDLEGDFTPLPPIPFMKIFKEALDGGYLEVPYQFDFTCQIG